MAKQENKNPNTGSQPSGKPTNNPGSGEIIIKGSVPTMRNPPPPPKKNEN
jgi:hypothetical protein